MYVRVLRLSYFFQISEVWQFFPISLKSLTLFQLSVCCPCFVFFYSNNFGLKNMEQCFQGANLNFLKGCEAYGEEQNNR